MIANSVFSAQKKYLASNQTRLRWKKKNVSPFADKYEHDIHLISLYCQEGKEPLSLLKPENKMGVSYTKLSRALGAKIKKFEEDYTSVKSIAHYIILPNQIHFTIQKKKPDEIPKEKKSQIRTLNQLVALLKRSLETCYAEVTQTKKASLFREKFRDVVCRGKGGLARINYFISHKPYVASLRQESQGDIFHCFRNQTHYRLGETVFDCVGNLELLDDPHFYHVEIPENIQLHSEAWENLVKKWTYVSPGNVYFGLWQSKGEIELGKKLAEKGASIIKLQAERIEEGWRPKYTKYLAKDKVLFLAPKNNSANPINELDLYMIARDMKNRFTIPPQT